ncbi:MAG: ankyrin repeat domain-containing protein [Oligoflexia bacterium]|nr:ankyrin repeat domain-containing protein [Oligoflexia bacterium]
MKSYFIYFLVSFLLCLISCHSKTDEQLENNPNEMTQDLGENPNTSAETSVKTQLNKDLIEAGKKGDIAAVKSLLAKGADVNAKDKDKSTVLMWASLIGHTEIVRWLIQEKANVNLVNRWGSTALIRASLYVRLEIVKLLIKAGANVNVRNKGGQTALGQATELTASDSDKQIVLEKRQAEVVRELKAAGATE